MGDALFAELHAAKRATSLSERDQSRIDRLCRHPISEEGLLDGKHAALSASQRFHVTSRSEGMTEVPRKRADVEALAAVQAQRDLGWAHGVDDDLVELDLSHGGYDVFALSRSSMKGSAPDLDRTQLGGLLRLLADERPESLCHRRHVERRHFHRFADLAVGIERIGFRAQRDADLVAFVIRLKVRHELRRLSDGDDEDARRERVECPRMTHRFLLQGTTNPLDHVVRRAACGLVDDEDATPRRSGAATHRSRSYRSRSTWRARQKAAPPPPRC